MYLYILDCLNLYSYMVDKPDGHYECTICKKQAKYRSNLKKHIENINFPGVYQYSCKVCGETLPTANKLNHHMNRNHPNVFHNS